MTRIELPPGLSDGKLLAAVSGGADSVCLLHVLLKAGCDVCAAHFEHGIRGEESRRDAEFVQTLCQSWGVPLLLEHGDVPGYAEREGLGLEEAARILRYAFLERCADKVGAAQIVTAHTLDDNAETLLFNLTRGSGTAGLCGIPRSRGRVFRPLLQVSRAEIEAYLAERHIPHREDSSNGCDDYSRNRIRHQVVPVLRQLNPRFPEAAARTAALLRRDEDCLEKLAAAFFSEHFQNDSLPCAPLCALHPAIASRVLRQLAPGLSMLHTDAALRFAAGEGYGLLDLPGLRLRREQGRLYFSEEACETLPERALPLGGHMDIPEVGLSITAEFAVYSGEIHDLFKTSYLKYEIVSPGLVCSSRRPGDRIRPLGRGCSKRLKTLFAEKGLSRAERARCPVLRVGEKPVLVYGLALDESAAPQVGEKAVKITFKNDTGENDGTQY